MVCPGIVVLPLLAFSLRAGEDPEAPPAPYTVRPSPADGSAAALNPPAKVEVAVEVVAVK